MPLGRFSLWRHAVWDHARYPGSIHALQPPAQYRRILPWYAAWTDLGAGQDGCYSETGAATADLLELLGK